MIYDKTLLTPNMVKQTMELGCLDRHKTTAAHAPTAKYRN